MVWRSSRPGNLKVECHVQERLAYPRMGIGQSPARGRVKPEWVSDSTPETGHSQVFREEIFERAAKDSLWPLCTGPSYEQFGCDKGWRSLVAGRS